MCFSIKQFFYKELETRQHGTVKTKNIKKQKELNENASQFLDFLQNNYFCYL